MTDNNKKSELKSFNSDNLDQRAELLSKEGFDSDSIDTLRMKIQAKINTSDMPQDSLPKSKD